MKKKPTTCIQTTKILAAHWMNNPRDEGQCLLTAWPCLCRTTVKWLHWTWPYFNGHFSNVCRALIPHLSLADSCDEPSAKNTPCQTTRCVSSQCFRARKWRCRHADWRWTGRASRWGVCAWPSSSAPACRACPRTRPCTAYCLQVHLSLRSILRGGVCL